MEKVYIGPFYSFSLAGEVFRRFITAMDGLGVFTPVLSYPQLDSPIYRATPQEHLLFAKVSGSKRAYEAATKYEGSYGIIFSEFVPTEDFLRQIYEKGITPWVVVVCQPFGQELAQTIETYSRAGLEIVPLVGSGTTGHSATWNQPIPIMPAETSYVDGADIVVFDRSFQVLREAADKLPKGKDLYVFDHFDFARLNAAYPEVSKQVKERGGSIRPFTARRAQDILNLVDGKSVVVGDPVSALFLGLVAATDDEWPRRAEIMHSCLLAMAGQILSENQIGQIQDAFEYKQVPDLPESLKNKEEYGKA